MNFADRIRAELKRAAVQIGASEDIEPLLERPRDPLLADWASNIAMVLARPLRRKPLEIANAIRDAMHLDEAGVDRVEIAGPGFLNFRLDPTAVAETVRDIVTQNAQFGRTGDGESCPVVVEFVSANPTGPLHVGHGRQAALGDAISSMLQWTGWKVSREFYYNDAGVQIDNLELSVRAHIEAAGGAAAIPEGGYHGEYVREIATRFDPSADDSVREFAVRALRAEQDLDMQAFGVKFDTYYLESSLYTEGKVQHAVDLLIANGHTYESEGALWLRTTDYGDDKDRVMRKRDGTYTYFVPDVAYHLTKWERGFTRAINVQGADHHSTVTRVRAGLQALNVGIPDAYPDYVLHQMVTVMKDGEEVKLSKRAGSYVTVRDLVDWVGRDAVRFFFLMRKGDSPLIFDVDLARRQSDENPVYYLQMAHARMSGIFRVGEIDAASMDVSAVDLSVLKEPEEQALIKQLLDLPMEIAGAAAALEPHRVTSYALETARLAHLWYHKHHVLNEPQAIMDARLALARASQVVLRNTLHLLGLSAPERM
ncbi:MAG: arginine--tRNA ligase [Gemmatimonadota bacterium]|nr:arginine--tRNA ligase [Gemmatimonadota bacterium]